jgi:hypothetical protein
MTIAVALALSLMLADAPTADAPPPGPAAATGEPLPPGAPTDSYELSAWCYGALDEYLTIYEKVIPDLKDMDRMFGTSVVEDKPYKADMAAARVELKLIGDSVTNAEKASPKPIAERGRRAVTQGRTVWSLAEAKSERELARAWMLWALPDRCDSNARDLTQRSLLLGRALGANDDGGAIPAATDGGTPAPTTDTPAAPAAPSSGDATTDGPKPATP